MAKALVDAAGIRDGLARALLVTQREHALPDCWQPAPPTLLPVNVEDGWQDGAWRAWPQPDSIVHGESFHDAVLVQMTGPPRPQGYLVPVPVTFRPEPTNPHDPHAVRVEVGGQHVGYIRRDLAACVAYAMKALGLSTCTFAGLLRGGYLSEHEDHRNVGVMVWPTKCIEPSPSLSFAGAGWQSWAWPPDEDEG